MVGINDELVYLEPFLKESTDEWEWKVVQLILKIPSGKLITYGKLAEWSNKEYNLNICALNAANCRRKIYHLLREKYPEFEIPVHRIIKQDDVWSESDSIRSRPDDERKRRQEGSWKSDPEMLEP